MNGFQSCEKVHQLMLKVSNKILRMNNANDCNLQQIEEKVKNHLKHFRAEAKKKVRQE